MVELLDELTISWGAMVDFVEESDEDLVGLIESASIDRVRYASADRVPVSVLRAVGDSGIYIESDPVLEEGRIELMRYVKEQSISDDYHRHGNLGARIDERRTPVL
jgi:RHH-type proline utilization regulon transcriptional repressor/proline dehydrogenase/delta 1-pyrroline-5-carboxylate dehydrogenase